MIELKTNDDDSLLVNPTESAHFTVKYLVVRLRHNPLDYARKKIPIWC